MRVGDCCSVIGTVSSAVIEGSILGLALYVIFIDPLLCGVHLPVEAYADDLKLVADVTQHNVA